MSADRVAMAMGGHDIGVAAKSHLHRFDHMSIGADNVGVYIGRMAHVWASPQWTDAPCLASEKWDQNHFHGLLFAWQVLIKPLPSPPYAMCPTRHKMLIGPHRLPLAYGGITGQHRIIALHGLSARSIYKAAPSVGFFFRRRGSGSGQDLGGSTPEGNPFEVTVLFVPVAAPPQKPEADWAVDCDKNILRHCPVCERDSIVGHGRRRKQAHDEHHDWIGIHRGRCADCGTTFTFLPVFSLPYTHFSLLARCQALQQRFAEHCSWEKALPKLKDADRLPDPSTVRHTLVDSA